MIDPEELQAAVGRLAGAEHGGVGVELLEVIERAQLQRGQKLGQVLVGGAGAELIPAGAYAPFEIRNHPPHVVGDDLQVGMLVEQPRKHQVRHGGAGLVGPAERPPDLVLAFGLALVIGEVRAPGGMHPDRPVQLGHQVEQRHGLGSGQRPAEHVGENLHAHRPQLVDGPLGLQQEPLRVVHRQRGDEGGKAVRILPAIFGHAVVGDLRHLGGDRRRPVDLDRGGAQADHLLIVAKAVHDPETLVKVDDAGDVPHALVHVLAVGQDLQHLVEVGRRENVVEYIQLHKSSFVGFSPVAAMRLAGQVSKRRERASCLIV